MRKRNTMLLSALLLLSSFSYAQSLSLKNVTVGQAITQLKQKTGYSFVYEANDLNTNKRVNVSANGINAIVNQILSGQNVSYDIQGKNIVVSRKNASTSSTNNSRPQQSSKKHKVSGTVTDNNGDPIIGATVMEKGTQNGTVTDINGKYSLEVNDGATLSVSYIGFSTQNINGNSSIANVSMKEDQKALDEVVVIGYGTARKVDVAGAISTADDKVFVSRSVNDATSALQGEVPGLTVIRNGGNIDDGTTLRVRDISSINGGTPLVLIDGAVGDLNQINPQDIANISVLKDGSAAIYGARAADGVILVTTKGGRKNQPVRINFTANGALKVPGLLKKPANLYENAVMALEITDGSYDPEYTADELPLLKEGSDRVDLNPEHYGRWGGQGYPKFYKNQDYNDLIIGDGYQQNYNVNISGGGERFNYMVSLGYQRNKGIVKYGKDIDNRYFVRTKMGIDILKNLHYDANISYEAGNRKYSTGIDGNEGQTIWELIYKTRTWAPLRNPAGHFYVFEGFDNPAQVLEEGGMTKRVSGNYTFNNQLTWNVVKGLNLIGQVTLRKYDFDKDVDYKLIHERNWEDDADYRTARTPNSSRRSYDKSFYRNYTVYAEYKNTFAQKHAVSAMAGVSHESEDYDSFYARRINYDQQDNMSLQLGNSEGQTAWSSGYAWTINSFFSRLGYTFDNKYIIEGTLRGDGSSRFAPGHRWGWFPGVNGAWRLSEESFMKKNKIFDDLKIRASYGEMGNQSGIGYYDYIPLITMSTDYYPFGNGEHGQMYSVGTLTSDKRTWETIKETDLGIDFAVLNSKLFGSFDYYWKKNNNMLIPVTYTSILGTTAPSTNSGKLSVNGWEVTLGWRDQINDFKYEVSVNVSDSKNKVKSRVGSNLIQLGLNSAPTGYPINSFFGYEFDGIIQNEAQLEAYKQRFPNGGIPGNLTVGDAMYKDLDGDGQLSVLGDGKDGSGDVKYLGDQNPRYNFGVNIRMAWKNFDFSAFIQGVGRRTMFLQGEADKPMSQPWFQSAEYWYGKTWTKDRTDAKYPAITLDGKRYYNYYYSTNTKHSVAYARLKNLQFGYTFPSTMMSRIGIQNLRVYFSGENLCEIQNTPGGWDPEENGDYWSYPFTRSFSIGVDVTF